MLSLLIGEGWQDTPKTDEMAQLAGVPEPSCESVGCAGDSLCVMTCVALDDRWFCAQGSCTRRMEYIDTPTARSQYRPRCPSA